MTGTTILALGSVAGSADDDDVDSAPSGDDADGSMDTGEGKGRGDDGDEVCAGEDGPAAGARESRSECDSCACADGDEDGEGGEWVCGNEGALALALGGVVVTACPAIWFA